MDLLKSLPQKIVPILFPQERSCHLCGVCLSTEDEQILCVHCAEALAQSRISSFEAIDDTHKPLIFALSAFWHQDEPRELVHLLKYKGDMAASVPLCSAMASAFAEAPAVFHNVEVLIPVPAHPKRKKVRGYNQSEVLAKGLGERLGLPVASNALIRTSFSVSQVHRTKAERLAAMKGVFQVTDSMAIREKTILLVDDVLTTGATAVSCAEALLEAGAASVFLITATCA